MKDLITEFFEKLNIESADSFNEILDNVRAGFGEEKVEQIQEIISSPPRDGKDADLFDLINSDPALSVTVFGGVEAGFFRKLFRKNVINSLSVFNLWKSRIWLNDDRNRSILKVFINYRS